MTEPPLTDEEREWQKKLLEAVINVGSIDTDTRQLNMEEVQRLTAMPGKCFIGHEGRYKYFTKCLLRSAIECDDNELLQVLLEKAQISLGKDQYFTIFPLLCATANGSLKCVKMIVEDIVEQKEQKEPKEPSALALFGPNDYASSDAGYITPMMLALKKRKFDIIEYFMDKKDHQIPPLTENKAQAESNTQSWYDKIWSYCTSQVKDANENSKSELLVYSWFEFYRARTDPIYICYKYIHDDNRQQTTTTTTTTDNPIYEVLDFHRKLQDKAR
jgi:hypothetical protein